jgi:transcriptional regulator with XRE-family HTH domain
METVLASPDRAKRIPGRRYTIRELFQSPTQLEAAEALDVDPSIVNRWVQGKVIPNGYNLQRLAKFFGISADDIDLQVPEGARVRSD